MHCPKCKTHKLKHGKVQQKDVAIDYCSKCKGIWFDHGEIEEMIPAAIKNLTIGDQCQNPSGVCPKCRELLHKFQYPQTLVNIDMCDKCRGIWIDAGELKEIQAVRARLAKSGMANEYADPTGIKGALLEYVERRLAEIFNY